MNFKSKVLIGMLVCGLWAVQSSYAQQEWVRLMQDPNANFYDIQRSFNEYWEGKKIERGSGWKQFKRWEYFMEPRVYPSGRIPAPDQAARAYAEYAASHRRLTSISDFSNWTPLGPTSWVTTSYNPGIGRINCSAVHPNNSDIIYVGAPSGGLWVSYDGGSTWNTTTDDLPVLGVTSIAIDPFDPDIVYLGTGDGDAGDTYSIGALKSTDGGLTWNPTGLNWTIYQARRISKILIHPAQTNVLLAATNSGVYKSTDAGASWSLSLAGDFKDMEFKPFDPAVVYVCGTTFHRSTDTGSSFTQIGAGVPSSAAVNRLAIAVTPANPDYVYLVGGSSANSDFYGLYRSTNGGVSFSLRSNSPNILGYAPNGSSVGGQSWYDLAVAASPVNAEEIYVGGINIWKSGDGGVSWDLNAYWFYPEQAYPYVHADIHALDFHGNVLYAGSDGGIFQTSDGGEVWTDISAGLANTQFYRFGGYPYNENLLIGGTQDNGTNLMNGPVWTHVLGADGMEALIDYSNPNILYACIQNGGLSKSLNGGLSFNSITNNITGNGAWVTPYVMDPQDPQILYAGFGEVWKTFNGGASWVQISALGGGTLQSLTVAPSDPQYIYAASQNNIFRTRNGGQTWANITAGVTLGGAITYIAVSHEDPEKLWVTLSGYSPGNKIFASTNAGNSWTNYSGSLPNLPANCVVQQKNSADALYVGTDIGIYYRNRNMPDWEPFNAGLPNVIVQELEIHYASGKLRAATYGRGIWESPLAPVAAAISHTPLGDTENISGPYEVQAEITPGSAALLADSLLVYYSTDLSFGNSAPLLPQGANQYLAAIPGQGSNVHIHYYISVSDENGLRVSAPPAAPAEYYRFYAGPDTVPPALGHAPIPYADIAALPLAISASASDNIGIDSVWVEYAVNQVPQPPFGLSGSGGNFQGFFGFDSNAVSLGDLVSYRVIAQDVSANMNQAVSGPHEFDIRRVLALSRAPNIPIPNNNPAGVSDVLTVSGHAGLQIIDVEVIFKAAHPNFGDLVVKLTSPAGTEITLLDRPGHPALPLGSPGVNPDIVLDDEAAESIENVTFAAGEQVAGVFRPDPGLLSAFRGQNHTGDWQINVADAKAGHLGTFSEWGLRISLSSVTGIDDLPGAGAPAEFALHQNYPNPFNPSTAIGYQLPAFSEVELTVYNLLGQKVRTLVSQKQPAGYYSVRWDGRNERGAPVSSGIYIYKIEAGDYRQSRRMLLLK